MEASSRVVKRLEVLNVHPSPPPLIVMETVRQKGENKRMKMGLRERELREGGRAIERLTLERNKDGKMQREDREKGGMERKV